jgi:hypothetical protein
MTFFMPLRFAGLIVVLFACYGFTTPPAPPIAGEVEPTPEVELYVADGGDDPLGVICIRCRNPTPEHVIICFTRSFKLELWSGDLSVRSIPGNTARVRENNDPPGDMIQGSGYFIPPNSEFESALALPVSWFFDCRDAAPGRQRFAYTIRFDYLMELAGPNGRSGTATSTGVIEFEISAK